MLQERLKLARKNKGYTQDDVANFLNVKRQTYSAYERGVSIPDAMTLNKLSNFFEVKVGFLLEDETDIQDFAEKIKSRRKELDYSQEQLARDIGISQPFMAEIESGKKKPSLEIINKLCNILGFEFLSESPSIDTKKEHLIQREKDALEALDKLADIGLVNLKEDLAPQIDTLIKFLEPNKEFILALKEKMK